MANTKKIVFFRCSVILYFLTVLVCFISSGAAESAPFKPEQPTMGLESLRSGMRGYTLTVLKGTKPVKLPLEVVSVVPGKGDFKSAVMIKMLPSPENKTGGVAQGMSGSPVYINGKLIGAISMGWDFSDHRMAIVTPIGDMVKIFSWPDRPVVLRQDAAYRSLPLKAGGLSDGAVSRLRSVLNVPIDSVPYGAAGDLPVKQGKLVPGEAVAVLMAWGDVELAAIGTLTATSKDGRFAAFGHPFLERGAINFPIARAYIHDTVSSQMFPFKIGSPTEIIGTATQDRASGVGGRTNYFTPSIAASVVFRDLDADRRSTKNFRIPLDAFWSARLLEGIYGGLIDDLWGRKGQGTVMVTLRVDGSGIDNGWTRTNMFFSDRDASSAVLKEIVGIIDLFLVQPFKVVYPVGFRLEMSVTQEPKLLIIEDVTVSSDVRAGESLPVEVTLRPWLRKPVKKNFTITVPEDATGVCELIVRGGGTSPSPQLSLDGGWKSIDSMERLMKELNAMDANNELYLELTYDKAKPSEGKDSSAADKKNSAELLPEEREFLSETKARRIKEGTLCISRTEYVVDGLMKRIINVDDSNGND